MLAAPSKEKKSNRVRPTFFQALIGMIIIVLAVYPLTKKNFRLSPLSWAQESSPGKEPASTFSEESEAGWSKIQELQGTLKAREREIAEKNRLLEEKEKQLTLIKKEIIDQVQALQSLKTEIDQNLNRLDAQEEEQMKKLLKLFEGTTPEKAGAILMDIDIAKATELIMRMDSRKASKIWGYLDPSLTTIITEQLMEKTTFRDQLSMTYSE